MISNPDPGDIARRRSTPSPEAAERQQPESSTGHPNAAVPAAPRSGVPAALPGTGKSGRAFSAGR
jgi:hypothetical protein